MTTCSEARAALLDADLDALRPGAPGPLGAHLDTCAACRAAADRIVSGTAALAVARGCGTRRAPASVVATALERGRRLRSRQRRMRVVVPLLAAASLAVFFVSDLPLGSPGLRPPVPAPPTLPPIVEAAGLNVAVFSTTRPDVTVVWQF
jgi:predicted anti-sigma-YlaC factor YlaD